MAMLIQMCDIYSVQTSSVLLELLSKHKLSPNYVEWTNIAFSIPIAKRLVHIAVTWNSNRLGPTWPNLADIHSVAHYLFSFN